MKNINFICSFFILSIVFTKAHAADLKCELKVLDSSQVGRIENAAATIVKQGQSTQAIDREGASIMYSLPSSEWHDYATIYVHAHAQKNGKINDAYVADEIKNIVVPMEISSNRKSAKLSYSHGGVISVEGSEILDIKANCEVK